MRFAGYRWRVCVSSRLVFFAFLSSYMLFGVHALATRSYEQSIYLSLSIFFSSSSSCPYFFFRCRRRRCCAVSFQQLINIGRGAPLLLYRSFSFLRSISRSCTVHLTRACVARPDVCVCVCVCIYSVRSVGCFWLAESVLDSPAHSYTRSQLPFIFHQLPQQIYSCIGGYSTLPLDEIPIWCALFQSVPSLPLASTRTVCSVFSESNERMKKKKKKPFSALRG